MHLPPDLLQALTTASLLLIPLVAQLLAGRIKQRTQRIETLLTHNTEITRTTLTELREAQNDLDEARRLLAQQSILLAQQSILPANHSPSPAAKPATPPAQEVN